MELRGKEKKNKDLFWIGKALEGKAEGYNYLLEYYYPQLYVCLRAMVNSDQEAEDLTIESLTKAFNSLPSYDKSYAFSTWIYRIARNHCIDYCRKRELPLMFTDKHYLLNAKADVRPSGYMETPETILLRQDMVIAVRDLVQKLSPHYCKLITLRYFHDYSYDELSKALNLSVDIIKVQLFRAKKRLKMLVDKEEFKKCIAFDI
ncbi:sigma-70 family RNA polymerase sigma factor [Halosquirtibacter laminarini]|uniref:Sigma-70 family RNA polymerase sigma factor n=1 Tax=Halosquirtibacter laminarini TaxID=3374600 RepID=A0AC61NDH0_9BACT|nr:sigma-70 family RNA polymerase sigma factor [Prolixibacteraceae bacterium]